MISFKALLEIVVEQGRRAVLHATRTKASNTGRCKQLKLSEPSSESFGGRVGAKLTHQQTNARGSAFPEAGTVATLGAGEIGGIFKYLRPVTSRIVQGLVRKVPSPLWAETRRRSAKRLFGETAPYFALVGVTLVSGPERGLLTAHDELEALCGDIREAISRAGWIHNPAYWSCCGRVPEEEVKTSPPSKHVYSLSDFELGPVIDKGCNAAVYAAKWKQEQTSVASEEHPSFEDSVTEASEEKHLSDFSQSPDLSNKDLWPLSNFNRSLQNISEGSHHDGSEDEAGPSTDKPNDSFVMASDTDISAEFTKVEALDLNGLDLTATFSGFSQNQTRTISLCEDMNVLLSTGGFDKPIKRKKVKFKDIPPEKMGNSSHVQTPGNDAKGSQERKFPVQDYPLAVKMMFNYEAESNAPCILTAMYKELIPARSLQLDANLLLWKQRFLNNQGNLPPHPNIVEMPCVFVDRVPLLEGGLSLYPEALPKRLNPSGFGRNMSLFCVMKRYDCTLAEYLERYEPSFRTSLLLLTQLLESISHINKYGVVHRDLKSDNILLSLSDGMDSPLLVLSDFGCCLPDSNLCAPFPSYEADPRLGNTALMSPEVKGAVPGLLASVNYSRADLWAAGTIALEIFGLGNPFIPGGQVVLDSYTYKESQIPRLLKKISPSIRHLIYDMLRRNPRQRPSPQCAATICQLSLWGPSKWLNRHALTLPSHSEVTRWLLCLSTKVLCEAGTATTSALSSAGHSGYHGNSVAEAEATGSVSNNTSVRNGGQLEYEIVSTFLSRVHYNDIIQAIKWVRAF